jgi:hypothetical protein
MKQQSINQSTNQPTIETILINQSKFVWILLQYLL